MDNKLNILWTTDNKDTVFNMLSMVGTSERHNLGSRSKTGRQRYPSTDGNLRNAAPRSNHRGMQRLL